MGDFLKRCRNSLVRAVDRSFLNNIANLILVVVFLLLLIALLIHPFVLVAIALLGLFIWAVLYC